MRTVWLVARRELATRVREKSFLLSIAVSVILIAGITVLPRLLGFGDTEAYRVAAVGPGSPPVVEAARDRARSFEAEIEVERAADRMAAERALRAGDLDAAVVDGRELLFQEEPSGELVELMQAASREVRGASALESAGVSGAEARSALDPSPLAVRSLDRGGGDASSLAFVVVLILYLQLLSYGLIVASGVVEEKASRVVEVVLSTIRPSQLLGGKILGLGLLGLLQLLVVSAFGLLAAQAAGALELSARALGTVALAFGWFLLGYAFYSCLFAVAGAIVSRQEELQSTTTPFTIVIFLAFFLAFAALDDPDSTLARASSFIPPVAPLVMPPRMAVGQVPAWEVALSVALIVATTAALVPLAARLYAGAVLRTGARVKLREAMSAGGRGGSSEDSSEGGASASQPEETERAPGERLDLRPAWPCWPAWYAPAGFVAALAAFLVASVAIGAIAAASGGVRPAAPPTGLVLALQGVLAVILVATALLFASRAGRLRPWQFGLRATPLRSTLRWTALGLAAFYALSGVYIALVGPPAGRQQAVGALTGADGTVALVSLCVALIVLAPVSEEVFFRGFFYRALRSRFPVWAAAIIDGAVFSVVHFEGAQLVKVLPLFVLLGVILCVVYEHTGSLYAVIAIHAFNNALFVGLQPGVAPLAPVAVGAVALATCLLGPGYVTRTRATSAAIPG